MITVPAKNRYYYFYTLTLPHTHLAEERVSYSRSHFLFPLVVE